MGWDDQGECDSVVDLMLLYSDCYTATAEPAVLFVPPRPYLMIEVIDRELGELVALRQVADELMAHPAVGSKRFAPMPIEGFWWRAEHVGGEVDSTMTWRWIAALCLPPTLTDESTKSVLDSVESRLQARLTIEMFGDGLAVQAVHLGPPEQAREEAGRRVHDYIVRYGYWPVGLRHEIYLTDPTRTKSGQVETIVRQPFRRGRSVPLGKNLPIKAFDG